jgi:uncharacterized coiled-coil protein SlyX
MIARAYDRNANQEKTMYEHRKQVAEQCRVVAHLARAIAEVYDDMAKLVDSGMRDQTADRLGNRSASLMEYLGEVLNNMDAISDDDAWTAPVFERAQALFPTPT